MSYRRPFNIFGAVPPPQDLRQGEIVSSPEEDNWSLVASAVQEGQEVNQEDLGMMALVSALGASEYRDGQGELLELPASSTTAAPQPSGSEPAARVIINQCLNGQWHSHETSPSQVTP